VLASQPELKREIIHRLAETGIGIGHLLAKAGIGNRQILAKTNLLSARQRPRKAGFGGVIAM
jgi:hypothetical protein